MKYKVKSGERTLEFDGKCIAQSSSFKSDSVRWVDFSLYVTTAGNYILERIGQSDVYHSLACSVVDRNKLSYDPDDELTHNHVGCEICLPDRYYDTIVLERPRYFALVTESPDAILEALHKKDKNNTKYMTYVAQKLIEEAIIHDKRLEKQYRTVHID
jgi:hypothetical protein